MDRAKVEALYRGHAEGRTTMAAHLPRLRALAAGLPLAVEFGVKRGGSSSALLLGAQHVLSYDLVETPQARELEAAAGDSWEYRIGDSRTADVRACDLLLVDSLHTYAQVRAELQRWAGRVRRWLVFHDSVTFGSIGADGETGRWLHAGPPPIPPEALGIRPAVDELMIADDTWRIVSHETASHGLLVLERRR